MSKDCVCCQAEGRAAFEKVYPLGKVWDQSPPEPTFSNAPVIDAIDQTREAVKKLLAENAK